MRCAPSVDTDAEVCDRYLAILAQFSPDLVLIAMDVLHDVQIRDQLTGSFGIAVGSPAQVTAPGTYSAGSPSVVLNSADPFTANLSSMR